METIWSWLPIGHTVGRKKVALDHRGLSVSTTMHCNAAIRVADRVRKP